MRHKQYKNLHQFTAFSPIFPINAYLYEDEKYLTIIDCGLNHFIKHFKKLSQKLNKPIQYIILTHPHVDHIAGLDLLVKQFPDIKIVCSKRDNRLLNGDFSLDTTEFQGEIKGGFKPTHAKANLLVSNGDNIGKLTAMMTPGHTPGSISLYENENKFLIVGDLLQAKGGLAIAGDKRKLFPFPALATWSKKDALKSVKKISQLEISWLATGHGNVIFQPDFSPAIQRLEKKIIDEEKNNT